MFLNEPAKEGETKIPVYCICRGAERPGMIGCDFCDEWFHPQCLRLNKEEVERLAGETWRCPNCDLKRGNNPISFSFILSVDNINTHINSA